MQPLRLSGRLVARLAVAGMVALLVTTLLAVAIWHEFGSLPLFVDYGLTPERDAPVVAVLVSGDMGLAPGLGHRIAKRLERSGVPVLGVNAPAYFLEQRSPAEIGDLVNRAGERALAGHPNARLVLIGQSFGADVLPFGISRLPVGLRRRLALVVLIVPTGTAHHRISPTGLFIWGKPHISIVREARALRDVPVLCIRGAEEETSLCPSLDVARVTQAVLPGGHSLGHDADRLFTVLREAIETAAGAQMTN